jgi:nucleoside-diphosphate-sugar epimerase
VVQKRVLITGHKGYIGSVMAPLFMQAGYEVIGLDTGYFSDCTLVPDTMRIPSVTKDIRNLEPSDLKGCFAVVHLAALSNDPIGNLDARWTQEINCDATLRLAEYAKKSGVERFLFSSSCIMYGMSEASVVNEDSPLDPRTEYARSKVVAEGAIALLAGEGFSPTFLRNGTIYGLSPRMRFDTVLNDLIGTAVATGKVIVHSDGKPWRPVVHVQDVARAFLKVLQAPVETIHNQAFNTGANELNYQILQLAEIAARTVPGCQFELKAQSGADQRTYKADFTKFARVFPDFQFLWTAEKGAEALYRAFLKIGFAYNDLIDKRFTRLEWLRHLMESGRLDGMLRWTDRINEKAHATREASL